MYKGSFKKRVRYAETDKMGYLYYGHYAKYYEIGRAELIRELGLSYFDLEEVHKIKMPVVQLECRYRLPALYDDLLTIETSIPFRPRQLIQFDHRVLNQNGQLLNTGSVKLFFVSIDENKRVSCPNYLMEKLEPYF